MMQCIMTIEWHFDANIIILCMITQKLVVDTVCKVTVRVWWWEKNIPSSISMWCVGNVYFTL